MTRQGEGTVPRSAVVSGLAVDVDRRAGAAGVVAGLGAFFLVRHVLVVGQSPLLPNGLDVAIGLLALTLLYAGFWLLRCDFSGERVGRIAVWSVAGLVGLVAVTIWLVGGQALPFQERLLLTLDIGTVGAASGLLVGLESERRNRRVDRGAIDAADAAERAEERFAFLNRLLRHHLLNGIAIVRGHAEILSDAEDVPHTEVQIIRRRSDEMARVIKNVDVLGRAFSGELTRRVIDPDPTFREAIAAVRDKFPEAEIRTDLRETAPVMANDRIDIAFEALLEAALGAAEGDVITVWTSTEDRTLVVGIVFDGAPPWDPVAGFEPGEFGEGDLGLYLAETLIEAIGGTITDPEPGTTGIEIRLPIAS